MGLYLRAIIVLGLAVASASAEGPSRGIPLVDLAGETGRQVVVDREAGQYLGHPTTVLLEDGRTILCVYPKGHGKGAENGVVEAGERLRDEEDAEQKRVAAAMPVRGGRSQACPHVVRCK